MYSLPHAKAFETVAIKPSVARQSLVQFSSHYSKVVIPFTGYPVYNTLLLSSGVTGEKPMEGPSHIFDEEAHAPLGSPSDMPLPLSRLKDRAGPSNLHLIPYPLLDEVTHVLHKMLG